MKTHHKASFINHLRFLSIARILCLVFILLFMAFVFTLMNLYKMDYQQLIVSFPALTAGFCVCLSNFFIFLFTRNMSTDLANRDKEDASRIFLGFLVFAQFLLFNYPSAILFALTLYKNFEWKHYTLSSSFSHVAKHKHLPSLALKVFALLFMIFLTLWFISAFR